MKVKVNDKVKILAGKDKGKEGKVLKTLKKVDKVIVEGINIAKKHQKPDGQGNNGGIIEIERPIHVSNVKVITEEKTAKKTTAKAETKKEETKKVATKTAAKKTAAKKTTTKKAN